MWKYLQLCWLIDAVCIRFCLTDGVIMNVPTFDFCFRLVVFYYGGLYVPGYFDEIRRTVTVAIFELAVFADVQIFVLCG